MVLDPANPLRAPGRLRRAFRHRVPRLRAAGVAHGRAQAGGRPASSMCPPIPRRGPALHRLVCGRDGSAVPPPPPRRPRRAGVRPLLRAAADARGRGRPWRPSPHACRPLPAPRGETSTTRPARSSPSTSLTSSSRPSNDLGAIAPQGRFRAGLGASLGGLALLHAHRSSPELFGALFFQSSSFFQRGSQPGSGHVERIESFVTEVLGGTVLARPHPHRHDVRNGRAQPREQPPGRRRPRETGLPCCLARRPGRPQLDRLARRLDAPPRRSPREGVVMRRDTVVLALHPHRRRQGHRLRRVGTPRARVRLRQRPGGGLREQRPPRRRRTASSRRGG